MGLLPKLLWSFGGRLPVRSLIRALSIPALAWLNRTFCRLSSSACCATIVHKDAVSLGRPRGRPSTLRMVLAAALFTLSIFGLPWGTCLRLRAGVALIGSRCRTEWPGSLTLSFLCIVLVLFEWLGQTS